jgi:hypothetical protein
VLHQDQLQRTSKYYYPTDEFLAKIVRLFTKLIIFSRA